jgi:hypothetical protein
MNIKIVDDNEFDFRCDRDTVIKVFSFLTNYKFLNLADVHFKIKTLIKISTNDLNYLLEFLKKHNFLDVKDDILCFNSNISEIEIFELLKKNILNQLNKIELLRNELFNVSKFIVIEDDILIETNSIPISYRKYFQMLENMQLIATHSDLAYKKVLDFNLGELLLNRPLKKISLIEFEKIQLQKKIKGEKAENYVYEFEKEKLKNTNYNPTIVSSENITLGYDIKSYTIEGDEMFIEVKALTDLFSFFWSNNEIQISKLCKNQYFIYCIEFEKGEPIFINKIIQNPYKAIVLDKLIEFREIGDLEVSLG